MNALFSCLTDEIKNLTIEAKKWWGYTWVEVNLPRAITKFNSSTINLPRRHEQWIRVRHERSKIPEDFESHSTKQLRYRTRLWWHVKLNWFIRGLLIIYSLFVQKHCTNSKKQLRIHKALLYTARESSGFLVFGKLAVPIILKPDKH